MTLILRRPEAVSKDEGHFIRMKENLVLRDAPAQMPISCKPEIDGAPQDEVFCGIETDVEA